MLFDEILGQEHLKQMIQSSLSNNSFPQSKIIVDKDGYGGLLFALAISERLLLEKGFKNSDVLNHPDLNFVFPLFSSKDLASELNKEWLSYIGDNKFPNIVGWMSASNSSGSQGSIRVKEIESMYKHASLKSFYGKKKVFIIWGGELLMLRAANKLLTILEEPPVDCYFIIITRNINEILPTIRSRCQISSLSPVMPELIEEKIKAINPDLDAKKITSASMGSWGRCLRYIQEGDNSFEHEADFVDCLRLAFKAKKSKEAIIGLMAWSNKMATLKKEEQKGFLSYCLYLIREALLLSYGAPSLSSFISSSDFEINKLSPFIHSKNILNIVNLIEDAHYSITRNVSSKIVFSTFCLNLTKQLSLIED